MMESALNYCRKVRQENESRYSRTLEGTAGDMELLAHAMELLLIDLEDEVDWESTKGIDDALARTRREELHDARDLHTRLKQLAQPQH